MFCSKTMQIRSDWRIWRETREKMLSTGIIVLIVLMVLCALLGSIYAYLYLTRINPQCLRRLYGPPKHRGPYSDPGGSNMDDDANTTSTTASASTHMFLFRKWSCAGDLKRLWLSALDLCFCRGRLLLKSANMAKVSRLLVLRSL